MDCSQSYLLSIRPYLSPRPSPLTRQEKGPVPDEKGNESKSLVTGAEDDEVFHWGREVDVNWGMVTYITFRDQVCRGLQLAIYRFFSVPAQRSSLAYASFAQPTPFHHPDLPIPFHFLPMFFIFFHLHPASVISVRYPTTRADNQFLSPLIQGALWGWAGLLLASTATGLRSSLYPVSPVSKGRITGGAGGGTDVAGGGEAVGGAWWSKWVKSWAGGIESATV